MNELPAGVRALFSGYGEEPHPDVQRDDMDRGPANQELLNSRIRWTLSLELLLETEAAFDALQDWYTNTIRVIGWFDMPHPRTRQVLRCRLEEGKLGVLQPVRPGFRAGTVPITVEFYR